MIDALTAMDTSLFLALNGAFPALDGVMWWVSEPLFWTPLYVALMVASARRLGMGRPLAVFAACVALCVTGTDVVSAQGLKPSVARLRPSHEPALVHDESTSWKNDPAKCTAEGGLALFLARRQPHGCGGAAWHASRRRLELVAAGMGVLIGLSHPPRRALPGDVWEVPCGLGHWGDGMAAGAPLDGETKCNAAMAEGITAMTWLAVFLGGGVGSVLRFGLGQAMRPCG